jgi:hypothetical protein
LHSKSLLEPLSLPPRAGDGREMSAGHPCGRSSLPERGRYRSGERGGDGSVGFRRLFARFLILRRRSLLGFLPLGGPGQALEPFLFLLALAFELAASFGAFISSCALSQMTSSRGFAFILSLSGSGRKREGISRGNFPGDVRARTGRGPVFPSDGRTADRREAHFPGSIFRLTEIPAELPDGKDVSMSGRPST